MKFMKLVKGNSLNLIIILAILAFGFLYYIVYRTEDRVAWYNEMNAQSESMIKEFKDAFNIR